MAVSLSLRRLLRIRDLEEEQSRTALEAAMGGLHRLQNAAAAMTARDRRGRRLVEAGARSGEFRDRLAGLEETKAAARLTLALAPRIEQAERNAAALRENYMAKRIERRQVETLIEEAEARDAVEEERKSQMALDDWYRNRRQATARRTVQQPSPEPGTVGFSSGGAVAQDLSASDEKS
jgi:hypothetical protein